VAAIPEDERLDARLAELETRLAFQDDLVGDLNREVSEQARVIEGLRRELEWLRESLVRPPAPGERPSGEAQGY
jgi:uncharacterized coiled-coil protein SlyX